MTLPTLIIPKWITGPIAIFAWLMVWAAAGNSTADAQTRSVESPGSADAFFGQDDPGAEGLFPNFSLGGLKSDDSAEPVTWGARYTPLAFAEDGSVTGKVEVVAKMASSWHIYSTTQPKGGPLKTTITMKSPAGVEATAAATPDREPTRSISSVYNGLTVEEFDDKVTWTIPFRGPANLDGPIEVNVRGLVCTSVDGRCMPTTETLVAKPTKKLDAKPAAPAVSSTEKVQPTVFRDEDYAVEWSALIEPATVRPGQQATLTITAKPDAPYHVYQAASNATPFSTNFVVTEKDGLLLGAPQTEDKVVSEVISPEMPPIVYHKGNVTWNIPILVPADERAGS